VNLAFAASFSVHKISIYLIGWQSRLPFPQKKLKSSISGVLTELQVHAAEFAWRASEIRANYKERLLEGERGEDRCVTYEDGWGW
jgi:hypothetical protein